MRMYLDGCLDLGMARSTETFGGAPRGAMRMRSVSRLGSGWLEVSTPIEGIMRRCCMKDIRVETDESGMEKTGNSEFVIYRAQGGPIPILMRHPGGVITAYDDRFGPLPEGQDQMVIPV
jgi:hypothetical protein